MKKEIESLISKNRSELIGLHTHENFEKLLNRIFRRFHVRSEVISSFEYDIIFLAALYDENDDCIDLKIYTNDHVDINEDLWDDFSFSLSQTLMHEMIHRYQVFRRNFRHEARVYKSEEEDEYLSNSDEIDAYSHDIALEMIRYYKKEKLTDVFSSISSKEKLESFHRYQETFHNTDWSFIYKRLMKKTYKWIDHYGL